MRRVTAILPELASAGQTVAALAAIRVGKVEDRSAAALVLDLVRAVDAESVIALSVGLVVDAEAESAIALAVVLTWAAPVDGVTALPTGLVKDTQAARAVALAVVFSWLAEAAIARTEDDDPRSREAPLLVRATFPVRIDSASAMRSRRRPHIRDQRRFHVVDGLAFRRLLPLRPEYRDHDGLDAQPGSV